MKIILSLFFIIFVSFVVIDVDAACNDGNCRAIQRYSAIGTDYTGSQYDIKIPDLFIDTANCEQKASVATTWVNIEPSRENVKQWIETGVTVGWIKNNDFGRDDSECISVESAYYGISAFDVDPDERTIEQNADPHGDTIGIEKSFRIEKLNNHYLAYYGDFNTQDLIRDYNLGNVMLDFMLIMELREQSHQSLSTLQFQMYNSQTHSTKLVILGMTLVHLQ